MKKVKEKATAQTRLYPSTSKALSALAEKNGTSIPFEVQRLLELAKKG